MYLNSRRNIQRKVPGDVLIQFLLGVDQDKKIEVLIALRDEASYMARALLISNSDLPF